MCIQGVLSSAPGRPIRLTLGCRRAGGQPADTSSVAEVPSHSFLNDLELNLSALEAKVGLAWWEASVCATPDNDEKRVAAELALGDVLADRRSYSQVLDTLAPEESPALDPLTRRQCLLLLNQLAPHQIEASLREKLITLGAEVDSAFSSFRGQIAGRAVDDNDINTILRSSNNESERRQAWEASKQVGTAVADRVRELATLRNSAARSLGYRDHFACALATSEIDEVTLFRLLDEIDEATAGPYREWKSRLDGTLAERFSCERTDLAPWHYDNVFFQSPPAATGVNLDPHFASLDLVDLTKCTFENLGFEVDRILQASDLFPRDLKNQHAFCADIDRSGDIRVLANIVPTEEWAETMLHEFGHAVHAGGISPTLPWTLRTTHSALTEGVAMLFGHLVHDPGWLVGEVGLAQEATHELSDGLNAAFTATILTTVRWELVMIHFERALYEDPTADLDTLWWDLVERYQSIRRPAGRSAPDWAAKIHIASAPVYYQNYLLGELIALQLRATILSRFGSLVGNNEAAPFLTREVFAPGASLPWEEIVARATGEPLSTRHLVEALRRP